MKNKIILTVIIFLGLVSNIFPQQTFRRVAYLTQSVGTHIYDHSLVGSPGTTTVPNEVAIYNSTHGYTGDSAFTIYNPTDDYPPGGNQLWKWWDAFRDAPGYSFKEDYLDTDTYDIIMIKHCAASQSGIWFWWYDGPQDTLNYPQTQSTYNYQWYVRKILAKMEAHPEKFFFWWNLPAATEEESSPADMQRLADFNKWMVDTLQAGLDSYGAFPPNVKIFDFFSLLKSPYSNYEDFAYRDAVNDYHPNAVASSLVAPILVQQMFDAARAYEGIIPVELTSFSISRVSNGVELNWSTATELNNDRFEIQRKLNDDEFISIGFVKGQGTSTQINYYNFLDKITHSGKYFYRLKQIDFDGNYKYSKIVEIDFKPISTYSLDQNYPNPFNPATKIRFNLPEAGTVKLTIYNLLSQEIRTLVNEYKNSGVYTMQFDASELNSGMYIYKIEVNGFIQSRKMILIK